MTEEYFYSELCKHHFCDHRREDECDSSCVEAYDGGTDGIINPQYAIEGAKTLSEAAQNLRLMAEQCEALESNGYQLIKPGAGGRGLMRKNKRND